jgi:hypothetical protein
MDLQSSRAMIARFFRQDAVALLLAFFPAVLLVQFAADAWTNDIGGGGYDESSHYVTGLMIHDYLAQRLPDGPLAFARNYYLHYPKVAFGVWPPLFHLLEAAWMLAFSPSKISVLLFAGLINALIATTLFSITRTYISTPAALGAGLVFLLIPEVMTATTMMMPDSLVALLSLWAMLSFAKFLQTRKDRYAYVFAGLASLCALTKGNGLALVLLPAFTVFIRRDWSLLRNGKFWIASLSSIVVSLPWIYFVSRFAHSSLEMSLGNIGVGLHALVSVKYFLQELGITMTSLFLAGVCAQAALSKHTRMDPIWATAAALILATLVFWSVNPSGIEPRYMMSALPPALFFCAAGLVWIGQRISSPALSGTAATTLVGCCALGLFAGFQVRIPEPHRYGYADIARKFANTAEPRVFLISSSAIGEGAAISEVAMRDHPRPKHFVLRASKLLAQSGWSGGSYRLLYNTPQEMSAFLTNIPVDYVIFDASRSGHETPHHSVLRQVLQSYPDSWGLLATYSGEMASGRDRTQLQVYQRRKPPAKRGIHFSIDLTRSLAGVLEYSSRP